MRLLCIYVPLYVFVCLIVSLCLCVCFSVSVRACSRQVLTNLLAIYRQCMTATEILAAFHVHYEEGITQDTFLSLCPSGAN